MHFAAIHIPDFPAAAAMLGSRGASSPIIVIDGIPPQEYVASCCSQARAAGVQHGMARVQAEAACSAHFVKRKPQQERDAFTQLCGVADSYSPRVEAVSSPANSYCGSAAVAASLLLDCSGMGTLFRSASNYARQLHRDVAASGFTAGVAIAPNTEAALMLARSTTQTLAVTQASMPTALAQLPVTLLPCEPRLLDTLARWGIRTLGELATLPDTALVSRLGQHGRRLQLLARGQAEHMLVPQEEAFTLCESTTFDAPVELLESLLFVISPLLEAAMRKAMERAYALRSVQLTLQLEQSAQHTVRVQPASPTQNRDSLLKLLNLELQAHPPHAGILGITLEAEAAQPTRAQRGLFQAQFPEADRLDLLLARLRAIAGEDNVGSPVLLNTHRDDAFAMGPFRPSDSSTSSTPHALCLRVMRPQQLARVTCRQQRPQVLFWRGARRVISFSAGPWHSSGSWWDGHVWDHDLWDVVLTEPEQAVRLKQDHASGAWSVVGVYD